MPHRKALLHFAACLDTMTSLGSPAMGAIWHSLEASLQGPVRSARNYNSKKFGRDLVAGLTVSAVELPQAMAYALLAGVPPQYGIYTSVIQGIIGALLSSSEHLTTGPTNTQSLLIASAVTRLADPIVRPELYLQLVFALTMLKGIVQLAFAAARFGDMVRYVSRSVIVGVAAGAGVLILAGQLHNFLGVKTAASDSYLPGVLGAVHRVWPHTSQVQGWSLVIGCISIAIVLLCQLISRFLPGSLLAVVVGAAIVATHPPTAAVATIGALPTDLPRFQSPWPGWEAIRDLLPGAFALATLGLIETVAIGKTMAARTGGRIDPNQEAFGQGLKNLLSSFVQCIPGSGSFTRSALDYSAGAATRFAAVYNAIFVAVLFLVFADFVKFIPMASLAAVLFVIGYQLIDWRYLLRIARTSWADTTVCLITFAATLVAPLEWAIFIGIGVNLALYLRNAARLHMNEMVQTAAGPFFERPIHDRSGEKQVIFLQLEGELFFGVADELQDQLGQLAHSEVRIAILRLKRTHSIDATVLHVLEQFTKDMHRRGGSVLLCGVREELMSTLRAYGLIDLLGKQNVFAASIGVFSSAKRALERAKELLGRSIDDSIIDTDESKEFTYQI